MAENAASSGLFAVFLLSIYSLFLIPYTIYRFCSAGEDVTTQPVVKVRSCCWFRCSPQQLSAVAPDTNRLFYVCSGSMY